MRYLDVLKESMITPNKIKVRNNASAAVIVRYDENNNKQILLIQRAREDHWPNHWEFPRGKCDYGESSGTGSESILGCVKREVKEETGLDIIPLVLIDKFQYLADAGERLSTCFNFLCKMKDPEQKVKLSKEHQDFKWISEIGQVELLVLPDQKKTIEKVLNSDRQIVTYPANDFTVNNKIEEYLQCLFNQVKQTME